MNVEDRTSLLAKGWTHGVEGASKRLREMINDGVRFDARDKAALSYLLMRIETMEKQIAEAQAFCDRWLNQRGRWR